MDQSKHIVEPEPVPSDKKSKPTKTGDSGLSTGTKFLLVALAVMVVGLLVCYLVKKRSAGDAAGSLAYTQAAIN